RAQAPADQHRDFHRLLVVQARIDLRLVGAREIRLLESARAADALGDVLARELEVHAAEHAALLLVNSEPAPQLAPDLLEAPGLVALGGRLRIAVHRVTDPEHPRACRAHGANHARQMCVDVLRTEARDEREPAWLVLRI